MLLLMVSFVFLLLHIFVQKRSGSEASRCARQERACPQCSRQQQVENKISQIPFCGEFVLFHRLLDTDVKRDALELAKAGLWDDAGPEQAIAQGGAGGGTLANSQVSIENVS